MTTHQYVFFGDGNVFVWYSNGLFFFQGFVLRVCCGCMFLFGWFVHVFCVYMGFWWFQHVKCIGQPPWCFLVAHVNVYCMTAAFWLKVFSPLNLLAKGGSIRLVDLLPKGASPDLDLLPKGGLDLLDLLPKGALPDLDLLPKGGQNGRLVQMGWPV